MDETVLVDTFLHLVKLNGPSTEERPVADYIKERLTKRDFHVKEDQTADIVKGNTGNLLCFPPHFDPQKPAMMMVAHMDTVRSTAKAAPIMEDGVITSENQYAIGADNRAGVTLLLHGADYLIQKESPQSNVVFIFTVCEELGPEAASALSVPENVVTGYIFDSSARPGTFIQSTFGAYHYELEISGKSAHAGLEPEKGINAIYLASKVIANIPVGRISKDLTCNVALINGGDRINVVPDNVVVKGEIRGSHQSQIDELLDQIKTTTNNFCREYGGEFSFTPRVVFSPYRISEQSTVYNLLSDVLRSIDLAPNPIHYSGGSDANVFNAKEISTINIGIGAQRPHAPDEFILIEDLAKSYQIVTGIIEEFDKRS